jgi:hypothetical protein
MLNNDIIKQKEISDQKINLLVIDISQLHSTKKTKEFLNNYFQSTIKPIISGG